MSGFRIDNFAICEDNDRIGYDFPDRSREVPVHVITKKRLRQFWEDPRHPRAREPLLEWYKVVKRSKWLRFADVKKTYNTCDQVGSKTVFDVGGNAYRVIVVIDYERQIVYIRAVLDHKEYDKGKWKLDTFGNDWVPFRQMIDDESNGQQK
jgi:mRNA interferase HigB